MTHPPFRSAVAAALVVLFAAACGGEKATEPTKPTVVPGDLSLRLTTPNADDGAIVLTITGPTAVTNVAASPQGVTVHARTVGTTTRVAVFGALATGELLHFTVPDVNAAAQFAAQVTEVSDRASALRASTVGYAAAVVR